MIEIRHLSKQFEMKDGPFQALEDVSLHVEQEDIYGIIGMSGAGKSTLIRCINLLEEPTWGEILIEGKCIFRRLKDVSDPKAEDQKFVRLNDTDLRKLRREIGMIFQSPNLLMQRTVEENIAFPLEIAGYPRSKIQDRVKELMDLVNILDKAHNYPSQLSGGQRQRVSIARAMANTPKILLCDEPTSALDSLTTTQILDLLWDINQQYKVTIVIITHEIELVKKLCSKVAVIDNTRIVDQGEVGQVLLNPSMEITRQLMRGKIGSEE
ncbi:MAG TPA: ATP-binding cassette domain-containing protein [Flexilinea sp.]|jgi:D-methionine transport system ATP-binding protein|nr:MAG: Methionine import ATP-binding protein MetN 2 [Chloroflexi bacterium ADurb.Bin344]HPG19155.1 ATP-binding cassette domain-containing protein [Flexilinea sp.]HPL58343.1 ATP-binding cassette domain-containing protein [Flexilinea sp.]HQF79993.1 ATP-binding cassette domain-containing protein [Flexilinea sp.]HQN62822.1 ATP-binding cassette domain-containing protein [Flexilinea sp.]